MFIELTTVEYQGDTWVPWERNLFNLEDIKGIRPSGKNSNGIGAYITCECEADEGTHEVRSIFVVETYDYITTVLRTTGNALMLRENNENTK